MDFDDWIRLQLAGGTMGPASAMGIRHRPWPGLPIGAGFGIQLIAVGMAVLFVGFGVLEGVPTPSLRLDLVPNQRQEVSLTSLALGPAPAAVIASSTPDALTPPAAIPTAPPTSPLASNPPGVVPLLKPMTGVEGAAHPPKSTDPTPANEGPATHGKGTKGDSTKGSHDGQGRGGGGNSG